MTIDPEPITREDCQRQAVSYLAAAKSQDFHDTASVGYLVAVAKVWALLATSAEPAAPVVDPDAVSRVFAQMMARISAYMTGLNRSVSRTELVEALPGRTQWIYRALDALVTGGFVKAVAQGQFTRFILTRPFPALGNPAGSDQVRPKGNAP